MSDSTPTTASSAHHMRSEASRLRDVANTMSPGPWRQSMFVRALELLDAAREIEAWRRRGRHA